MLALPWLGTLLAGVLVSVATSIVYRVLAALTIGAVSYMGFSALVTQTQDFILGKLGAAGPVFDFMSLFGFGVVINIMFSALTIRLTLAGLKSDGSLMKLVTKGK
jgi:hypothetical protein